MEEKKLVTRRVKITPMRRLRILTNQRMEGFNKANLITKDFISDMISSYEKQTKTLIRTLLLGSLYLAIMFTAYSGTGVNIAILGVNFSDVPRLLEISIALFSFSLFYIAVQNLNLQILLQAIDSMIGSIIPDDEISQGLVKYRYAPLMNFFSPFQRTLRNGNETIVPVGVTKTFNFLMITIGLAAVFSVYIIPIIFMLGFAVPKLTTSIASIAIGCLAWACSCFLICSFLISLIKLPYDETYYENSLQEGESLPE